MSTMIAKIKSTFMPVTPQLAMQWLEKNTHNRPIAQQTVNTYARDMVTGAWTITHQGIAICEDGRIIDGQHRLWAIVESGKTITMLVTTGLGIETQQAIDGGRTRTVRDVIALMKRTDGQTVEDKDASPRIASESVGVARLLASQLGNGRPSRDEQIRTYGMYEASIKRAIELFPRRVMRVQNSHVLCVITRAIECQKPVEDLARFVYMLVEGAPPDTAQKRDEVVRLLRNFLLEPRKLPKRSDIYKKTERALLAYLDGEIIKTIYPATDEVFRLKTEAKPTTKKPGVVNSDRRRRGAQIPLPPAYLKGRANKFANNPRLIS